MSMNEELSFSLGARLRLAREKAGLSQDDMAEAMAISQSSVKNWELGYATPTPRKIRRWAAIVAQRSNFALTDLLDFIDIDSAERAAERRRVERRGRSTQPPGSIRCFTPVAA